MAFKLRPAYYVGRKSIFVFIELLIFASLSCDCLRFILQPHTTKCLKQEMYTNQLAVGEYEISNAPGTQVDMIVKDYTNGHIALKRENIDGKGKFALTSDQSDYYDLCFTYVSVLSQPGAQYVPREIFVDYRIGAEAKSQDDLDTNDSMVTKIETTLDRIEDMANAIINDFAQLKKREREMRDTNESTNKRMFYQAITSIIVVLALATWQVLYFRTYFKIKKLID